jgi:hypothetical protein
MIAFGWYHSLFDHWRMVQRKEYDRIVSCICTWFAVTETYFPNSPEESLTLLVSVLCWIVLHNIDFNGTTINKINNDNDNKICRAKKIELHLLVVDLNYKKGIKKLLILILRTTILDSGSC